MSDENQTQPIDISSLTTTYANVCRIAQTPNGVIELDVAKRLKTPSAS
jgi:hypothetical protein